MCRRPQPILAVQQKPPHVTGARTSHPKFPLGAEPRVTIEWKNSASLQGCVQRDMKLVAINCNTWEAAVGGSQHSRVTIREGIPTTETGEGRVGFEWTRALINLLLVLAGIILRV